MENKIRLGICIPCYRNIESVFWISFTNMIQQLYKENKYDIEICTISGQPVDKVRNKLVQEALDKKCDYIWFIDSDMCPCVAILESLMSLNQDIVSAICFQRHRPHEPAARIDNKPIKFTEGDIMEVDEMGGACLLIKADVFKNTKFPWFKRIWKDDKVYGEDLYFANYMRKCGYKIYVNTGVSCDHYGTEITIDHYKYYKQLMGESI